MKKVFVSFLFCMAFTLTANAQKFALVDMEYIMENIPAYQQAVEQLDKASKAYQNEIEKKANEAEALYKS